MTRTDHNGEILTVEDVSQYLARMPKLASRIDARTVTAKEVGDGNLNLVFICTDEARRRIVLKQALPYLRLAGPAWPLTTNRACIEANALRAFQRISPGEICELIDYDAGQCVLVLEDLSDYRVLRDYLNSGDDPGAAFRQISCVVARILMGTSWVNIGENEFRLRAAAAVNPELCAITETLVFTEPFLGASRNRVRPALAEHVRRLQCDSSWTGAATIMKRRFLTKQETLLHGDLHSGSVFIRVDAASDRDNSHVSVKVFDAEFACYGPVGFDLGLLWANIMGASVRAATLGDLTRAERLVGEVAGSWEAFSAELLRLWERREQRDNYPDSFLTTWLPEILDDALGFAGCEATRRIVGLAKISDIETLDSERYAVAALAVLDAGERLLVQRSQLALEAHLDAIRASLRMLSTSA